MKKFNGDYSVLAVRSIILSLLVILRLNFAETSSSIVITLITTIFLFFVFIYPQIKEIKTVFIKENKLLIDYLFSRKKEKILFTEVDGLIYRFYFDERSKIRYKRIYLLFNQDKNIVLSKTTIRSFQALEEELRKLFPVLKMSDGQQLTYEELSDFDRENKYFDIEKAKTDNIYFLSFAFLVVFITYLTEIKHYQGWSLNLTAILLVCILLTGTFINWIKENIDVLKRYKKRRTTA